MAELMYKCVQLETSPIAIMGKRCVVASCSSTHKDSQFVHLSQKQSFEAKMDQGCTEN